MSVLKITNDNFENEVMGDNGVVLIDFYANWCQPCKMMSPIIDEISEELKDKIKVGKVNIDENQELASYYNIMSIPTMVIFKQGKEVKRFIGTQSKQVLLKEL